MIVMTMLRIELGLAVTHLLNRYDGLQYGRKDVFLFKNSERTSVIRRCSCFTIFQSVVSTLITS